MPPLLRNVSSEGFWPLQGEVFVALFDRYIQFAVEDAADIEYVEKCAKYLNNLDVSVIESLCQASIRYCDDFLGMTGQDAVKFLAARDVLKLISPRMLIVPNADVSDKPVVHMELNCDWEIEHGVEWIIRDEKVLYVGAFNDSDPWGEYLEKKSWNYA